MQNADSNLNVQTDARPRSFEDNCCFVTDAEIIRRLMLPEKIGRRMLRELDRNLPNRTRFPQKDPLSGDRRFWPAVKKYFNVRYGVHSPPLANTAPQWQENFDAPRKASAKAD